MWHGYSVELIRIILIIYSWCQVWTEFMTLGTCWAYWNIYLFISSIVQCTRFKSIEPLKCDRTSLTAMAFENPSQCHESHRSRISFSFGSEQRKQWRLKYTFYETTYNNNWSILMKIDIRFIVSPSKCFSFLLTASTSPFSLLVFLSTSVWLSSICVSLPSLLLNYMISMFENDVASKTIRSFPVCNSIIPKT